MRRRGTGRIRGLAGCLEVARVHECRPLGGPGVCSGSSPSALAGGTGYVPCFGSSLMAQVGLK